MGRKMVWLFLALLVSLGATNLSVSSEALSAEKLKLGTAIKTFPPYYLVMLTAEEKGLWNSFRFSRGGKISPEALANVRDILIQYRVISKEMTTSPDELFTNRTSEIRLEN